jgi:hypothetical protein
MQRLAKAFLDIALWRRTPAHLPASLFLLVLTAGAEALTEVFGAVMSPGPQQGILAHMVLGVGLPLVFTGAVLAVAKRRARFLQTATALLGVDVLATLILYPLGALFSAAGEDSLVKILIGIMLFIGLVWYLLAGAHIWRSALDSGLALGGIISVGCFVLSIAIEQQMLPQT